MNIADTTKNYTTYALVNSNYHFTTVYAKYADELYQYAFDYIKYKQEAEDLIQEVFSKAWRHWHRINNMEHVKAYLFKMTYNEVHSYFRKEKRKTKLLDKICKERKEFYFHDSLLEREYQAIYRSAIEMLPCKQRQVYLMKQSEFSRQEIAEKLNRSYQTINNQIAISTKSIKRYICRRLDIRLEEEDKHQDRKAPAIAA